MLVFSSSGAVCGVQQRLRPESSQFAGGSGAAGSGGERG